MSVRTIPPRNEVQAAEALYQRLRDNPGMHLSHGHLAPSLPGRLWNQFMDLNLSTKLWLSTLSSMIVILLCAGLGWAAVDAARGLLHGVDPGQAKAVQATLDNLNLMFWLVAAAALLAWPVVALAISPKNRLICLALATISDMM